jgi:hypothetical protein
MSVALSRALSSGSVSVRKVASGEAIIVFRNPVQKTDGDGVRYSVQISPVRISHGNAINLFQRKEVDEAAIKQSNLTNLVQQGVLEVV